MAVSSAVLEPVQPSPSRESTPEPAYDAPLASQPAAPPQPSWTSRLLATRDRLAHTRAGHAVRAAHGRLGRGALGVWLLLMILVLPFIRGKREEVFQG